MKLQPRDEQKNDNNKIAEVIITKAVKYMI